MIYQVQILTSKLELQLWFFLDAKIEEQSDKIFSNYSHIWCLGIMIILHWLGPNLIVNCINTWALDSSNLWIFGKEEDEENGGTPE